MSSLSSLPTAAPPASGQRVGGLRSRLRLAFGLLSALVVVVALIALWGFAQLRESARLAVEVAGGRSRLAHAVAVEALQVRRYELSYLLSIADDGQRNDALAQWQQASGELYIALNNLDIALPDDADRRQVREWQATFAAYRRGFDWARLAVETGQITAQAEAIAAIGPEREQVAGLADLAVDLAARQDELAQEMGHALGRTSEQLSWLLLATGVSAAAASVAWGIMLPVRLTRPIVALGEAAARFSGGEKGVRVPIERRDELGVLATSFNHMATTIERQLSDLEAQNAVAREARDIAQAARASIAEQLATIEAQRAVIADLSVPLLPITATTLLLPLIGSLDGARLDLTIERALDALQRSAARHLILDVTGVPVIDTQVAAGLLRVVRAAGLLGAAVVLVGIRPEVAQALVGLGVDLGGVVTRATLQSGIEHTLRQG